MIEVELVLFSKADSTVLLNAAESPEALQQWAGRSFVHPLTREQIEVRLILETDERVERFAVVETKSSRKIGFVELTVDLQARVGALSRLVISPEERRGCGFGKAAVQQVIAHAFDDLQLERLELRVFDFNEAAIRCYKACGFQIEGHLRGDYWSGRERWSNLVMGLLRADCDAARQASVIPEGTSRCPVLFDDDLRRLAPMSIAIATMRRAFQKLARGELTAPPRIRVPLRHGTLAFTVGGDRRAVGYRAYEDFGKTTTNQRQVVAVHDAETGELQGLFVGSLLGAIRTGAIGGVAMDLLARPGASRLAVIGAGLQARTQIEAAVSVRAFKEIALFAPSGASAVELARSAEILEGPAVRVCDTAEQCVCGADVVICATGSSRPVLESSWIQPGTHVQSVGPKFRDAHELPIEIQGVADRIFTDSVAQLRTNPTFLDRPEEVRGLDELITGTATARTSADQTTLFLSCGLAGTEVLLGLAVLSHAYPNARG